MRYSISLIAMLLTYTNASAFEHKKDFILNNSGPFKSIEWEERTYMWKKPARIRNQAWINYTEKAKAHPLFGSNLSDNNVHFCENETQTCAHIVFFEESKKAMMMAEITDLNNNILVRATCYFPRKEMDERICHNFDRGDYTHSVMKSDGNWVKIS